jgi:L-asparaginase
MNVLCLTAGGTIDKVYFDRLSDYQVGPPGVERILQELSVGFDYSVQSVLRKDSLDMTDDDRLMIRKAVRDTDESRILITHGTDTMIETAKCLDGIQGKRVVLTGAMQPAGFQDSDAVFNVGMAIGVLLASSEPGVWIVMSGGIFDPWKSRKNRSQGVFETVE